MREENRILEYQSQMLLISWNMSHEHTQQAQWSNEQEYRIYRHGTTHAPSHHKGYEYAFLKQRHSSHRGAENTAPFHAAPEGWMWGDVISIGSLQ